PAAAQAQNYQNVGWWHASAQTVVSETARIAAEMLQLDQAAWARGQPGGTLFFYMTSHGAPGGLTSTSSGELNFSSVAAAIKQSRGNVLLERLIVMFDTCFSGSNKNTVLANSPGGGIVPNTGLPGGGGGIDILGGLGGLIPGLGLQGGTLPQQSSVQPYPPQV